ncbi:hypothetical protein GLOIN_2v1475066 [Rhizophagus irregularis DAOM 181602=DAOM 197198]|uniref:Uncharacterized protein n=1 Tax=Rhizophagus irregularis (strain DAOM 181602 / DAOM 197198 / MUCL 43194) TaxID=747089 RepID=A0A2P4QDZ8_RHIID|nr:hypothetical protein GLOIN_2v1475066 [Rhizophagus irregularis DAOM 181602=DAOM 197198]POG75854.1 hypothetical protein GLOIN_2v1475066 [Rhizophagus irregularis DAOM 181602=DAOM 197198]|eukprot:XP_025182720.1 hypothetical protein GLOIN_2v1475066 [Rhizophagus irregularis DAOM 181602=DAOM 197198]
MSDINRSEQRITQLEQQVQSLLNSVKTLQEGKSKVDNTIADIHHNHNLMSSSLNDITIRLDKYDTILQPVSYTHHNHNLMSSSINNITTRLAKYDTIIQQLTTNINLLSQEQIAQHKERSVKTPKRPSPYEQTSYRATKNRYNLRGNKQGNILAKDSEQHPLTTDDDTDTPDDAAMSDGAVFEGIIDEVSNATSSESKFSVKSYNPLNLLPQFNATR